MSSSKLIRSRNHRNHKNHNSDNHGSTAALFGAMNGHSAPSGSASSSNGGGGGNANIWQLMNYSVPRGKCVHKQSVLLPVCPCLRFMLNPLQAASSFACDGCGHHASYHQLKNGEEPAEAFAPPVSSYTPEAAKGAKKRGASVHGAAVRGLVNGRASSNGAATGGSATGRRGIGGIGALLVGASASEGEDPDDDDVQVLDGDMLQVVKRSRGG